MIISLEYIIAQYQKGKKSIAIKSHRNRRQNPGLEVIVERSGVVFQLFGLTSGTIELADANNPSATRLDFYVGKGDFLDQINALPNPRARATTAGLTVTNPTGSVRRGGKRISWRGPIAKYDISGARLVFPDRQYVLDTMAPVNLNIDWEPAMYPLSDGKRLQLHFGVESIWIMRLDRRRTVADAKIFLTHTQYANVLDLLRRIR